MRNDEAHRPRALERCHARSAVEALSVAGSRPRQALHQLKVYPGWAGQGRVGWVSDQSSRRPFSCVAATDCATASEIIFPGQAVYVSGICGSDNTRLDVVVQSCVRHNHAVTHRTTAKVSTLAFPGAQRAKQVSYDLTQGRVHSTSTSSRAYESIGWFSIAGGNQENPNGNVN